VNEISDLGARICQWLLHRCRHVHGVSYCNAPGMSSKPYNPTYLTIPGNSSSYPLNSRPCDPRGVWIFLRKETPFAPVMNQTTIYWASSPSTVTIQTALLLAQIHTLLLPSEKLCPAALSTISGSTYTYNSW